MLIKEKMGHIGKLVWLFHLGLLLTVFMSFSQAASGSGCGKDCSGCTLDVYVWDQSHNPINGKVYLDSTYKGYNSHIIICPVSTHIQHTVMAERFGYVTGKDSGVCYPGDTVHVDLTLVPFVTSTTTTPTTTTVTTTTTVPSTTTTTVHGDYPPEGTLTVGKECYLVGETIGITVKGTDDNDIWLLGATFDGTEHPYICSGTQTICSNTWTTVEPSPGIYTYCGYVEDNIHQGVNTVPSCIHVTVATNCGVSTTTTTIYIPPGPGPGPKTLKDMRIKVNKTCVKKEVTLSVRTLRNKFVSKPEMDVFYEDKTRNKKVSYGLGNYKGDFKFIPEKTGNYYVTAKKSKYYTEKKAFSIESCESLCKDGIKNLNEIDIDCGGDCGCCEEKKKCEVNSDCCSGYCYKGSCETPSCYDGILNQGEEKVNQIMSEDESDIADCGGPNCPKCPTCYDGIQNQGETDIDSGGPNCNTVCKKETCKTPTCFDGLKNQGETDIDCGGPCDSCYDGDFCRTDDDCLSDYCLNNTCRTPTCSDGIENQDEEGVDCGGESCEPCPGKRYGIIGSIFNLSGENSGGIFLILILLFLILSYLAYKRGKERGRQETEVERDIEAVLGERVGGGEENYNNLDSGYITTPAGKYNNDNNIDEAVITEFESEKEEDKEKTEKEK